MTDPTPEERAAIWAAFERMFSEIRFDSPTPDWSEWIEAYVGNHWVRNLVRDLVRGDDWGRTTRLMREVPEWSHE